MKSDNDWDLIRPARLSRAGETGMGVLRITLLFGSAAIAIALIATPYLSSETRPQFARSSLPGIDTMSTGRVGQNGRYTIRKSVLQASPTAECLIMENGARSGAC